jgi:hypothetical protein
MGWIYLAQDGNHCRTYVNTVMNLRGSIIYLEIPEYLIGWFVSDKKPVPWNYYYILGPKT